MKTKTILICMLIGFCSLAPLTANNSLFNQANLLYEEGQYDQALNLYQQLEQEMVNWKLFFNIGNCFYKQNQFVTAKIYYLRAQRLQPLEPSIKRNIYIVNKYFKDAEETEKDFITRMIQKIESLIPLNLLSVLIILLVFLINGFIFLLIKIGKRRILLYGLSFSLVFALFFSFYHIYRVKKINTRNTAVIIKEDSQLRSGPGFDNTVLFKVNPGIKVRIIDKSRNWFQVTASRHIAGWIVAEDLEQI